MSSVSRWLLRADEHQRAARMPAYRLDQLAATVADHIPVGQRLLHRFSLFPRCNRPIQIGRVVTVATPTCPVGAAKAFGACVRTRSPINAAPAAVARRDATNAASKPTSL